MKKLLLLFAIFFAVSNAAIFLQYYPSNKYPNELQLINAIAASPAVRGQYNTIRTCSIAKSEVTPSSFTYEVVGGKKDGGLQIFESGTRNFISGKALSAGSNFCFSLSFKVPEDVERQFLVKFDLFNTEKEGITNFSVLFNV